MSRTARCSLEERQGERVRRGAAPDPPLGERAAYTRGAVRRAAADADPHDEEPVRGERLLVVRSLFNSYVGEGYAASTATAAASAAEAVRGAAPDVMLRFNAWVSAQAPGMYATPAASARQALE